MQQLPNHLDLHSRKSGMIASLALVEQADDAFLPIGATPDHEARRAASADAYNFDDALCQSLYNLELIFKWCL